MLKKEDRTGVGRSTNIVNDFSTNPIQTKVKQSVDLSFEKDININNIPDIVECIYSLGEGEVKSLMIHNNEIVRGIAARAFVDKNPEFLTETLKIMLSDVNENLRDSAVVSLCYLNSPDTLGLLERATQDESDKIKLRALTGLADLAIEHSLEEAKDSLKSFQNHACKEIREFVNDELSII